MRHLAASLIAGALLITACTEPAAPPDAEQSAAPAFGLGFPNSKLIGWWKFDDALAPGPFPSDVVRDASGFNHHGKRSGATAFSKVAVSGTSLGMKAASGKVTIQHTRRLEPPTGTIGLWIKVPALKNADVVAKVTYCFVRREPGCPIVLGRSVIGLRIEEDGGVHAFIANDDPAAPGPWTFARVDSGIIEPNTWHHLAMRWDGSKLTLFVDGRPRAATAYDPVPGTGLSYHNGSPLWFGVATSWGPTPGDKEYIGLIDEARYYAGAVPDAAIRAEWKAGHKPSWPGF